LRGDLETLRPSALGVFLATTCGPLCEEGVPSKLSRYETTIEQQLYRALHELERRQAARRGAAVTPPRFWTSRFQGCPKRRGTEIWLLCTDFTASCRLPPKNGSCKGETARVEESHLAPVTVLYCFRCCHYCCYHEPWCCLPSTLNLFARGDTITCLARLKSRWKFRTCR
jgi:hypothetical protein